MHRKPDEDDAVSERKMDSSKEPAALDDDELSVVSFSSARLTRKRRGDTDNPSVAETHLGAE